MGEGKNIPDISNISKKSPIHRSSSTSNVSKTQSMRLARMAARQVESQARLEQASENMIFIPRDISKKFQPLKEKFLSQPQTKPAPQQVIKSEEQKEVDSAAEEIAEDYFQLNPELQKKTLMILHQRIKPEDTHEQIFEKITQIYADKSLIDSAINYLIDTAQTKEEIKQKLIQIKQDFNAHFGREIRAGHNILAKVHEFSEKGLGSKTGLRDLYRDITGNPRTPHKLFEELIEKFKFSDMKNIIDFILHSLGADMKADGPSIDKAKLQRFCEEARTMQAFLGVFRFFHSRMPMIKKQFDRAELTIPSRINFDTLARLLMKILQERYPTPDKIIKLGFILGIVEEAIAQIIIFSQYRDAMRHISPKLFRSKKHQKELFLAFIETLSDLEDELEEEEDEDKPPPHPPKDTIE